MKTPPLLLGATLLFWGWQTDLLIVGGVMGVALEASRLVKSRWEFSDEEFRRIWIFCNLVLLAALFYAFNANQGPATLGKLLDDPTIGAQTHFGTAGARTVVSMIRWSPMVFFLFVVAQAWSSRAEISTAIVSIFLWRRRRRALKTGTRLPPERKFNASYPFFGMCLLAASIHTNEVPGFFWGFSVLMTWALWAHRSRRLNPVMWAAVLAIVIALGQLGQTGLNQLQRAISAAGAQWLAEFFQRGVNPNQNTTAIGQLGRISGSGKIIIRLETKSGTAPPTYLREASYRRFRSPRWFADRQEFENINVETNGTTWVLVTNKLDPASVNIACYLPGGRGLLPLPTRSSRLENLDVFPLSKNPMGAVLAEGPGLVIFDPHYGPGETMDSPANTNVDLEVPTNEVSALDMVIEELQVAGLSPKQKLAKLQKYFETNFTYSVWQGPLKGKGVGESPLSLFLLQTHSGHCEYFASATVLLLREMKIPARYAIGYAVHEGSGNKYVVRQRDGHAWCLVWDDEAKTWNDFDTTPASRFEEEEKRASSFQWLSDAWSRLWFEIAKFRWGQSEIRRYILWALIPILAFLFYQIVFRRSWRRRAPKTVGAAARMDWPGLDSEFYQLERRLADFIGARRTDETFSDWLERVVNKPELAAMRNSIHELLRLHYRYRFDPLGLDVDDRTEMKRTIEDCLKSLMAVSSSPS